MTLRFDAVRRYVVTLVLTLLLTTVLIGARTVQADTFSVFADLPVTMNLKVDAGTTSESGSGSGLSGYKAGITLPIFVGLAYESYGSKFDMPNGLGKFNYDVTMYDLFLNLPLPIINIAAGLGTGTGKISNLNPPLNAGVSVKDATLTQYFISLGYPILPLLDIHFGYHVWKGSHDVGGSTVSSIDVNGTMLSLGAKLGF